MKTLILVLVVILFSASAQSQCEDEKKRADKWNDSLRHKVTEFARKQHRKAKTDFLECLRQPESQETTQSSTLRSKTKKSPKRTYVYQPNRHEQTSHVTVSDYTNFKGEKKLAWNNYFQESDECLSNNSNMKIFVDCAKVRKQQLKLFNARWNEQTKELMPLLDKN